MKVNRTINVEDEQMASEMRLKGEALARALSDKTYDEFMKQYLRHLEGKIDPLTRIGERPETAPFDPNKKRVR